MPGLGSVVCIGGECNIQIDSKIYAGRSKKTFRNRGAPEGFHQQNEWCLFPEFIFLDLERRILLFDLFGDLDDLESFFRQDRIGLALADGLAYADRLSTYLLSPSA